MVAYLKEFLCVLCAAFYYVKYAYADPVGGCRSNAADRYGNYYVADDADRCVFYWCFFDEFVSFGDGPFVFACPPRLGTVPGSQGSGVICTEVVEECGAGAGGGGEEEETTVPDENDVTTASSPVVNTKPGMHLAGGLLMLVSTQPGMHLAGGLLMRQYREPTLCLLACVADEDCFGADFNNQFLTCWFHNASNVCRAPQAKDSCTHYKFVQCAETTRDIMTTTVPPPTTTTMAPTTSTTTQMATTTATTRITMPTTTRATTTTTTLPPTEPTQPENPIVEILEDMNLGGGQKQEAIRDIDLCMNVCYVDPACVGLDFDFRDLTCWLHTRETECTEPREKAGCKHYRLEDVCSSMTTEEMTTDDVTEEDTTETMDPDALPSGFHSMLANMHLSGGDLLLTEATLQQCLDACLMQAACLAVDFDTLARTCYGFGAENYCAEPLPMSLTNHYRRVPCIEGTDSAKLQEVRLKFHRPQGLEVCSNCELNLCLEFCFLTSSCQGVDYDERNMGCYMHTETSICGPLISKDYCTHYSFHMCDDGNATDKDGGDGGNEVEPTTQEPVEGFPAPSNGFIALNYAGPKVLPSGWQAYPGMQVDGGRRISFALSGDECFTLCDDSTTCLAVDFNSYDGSCYFFEAADTRCDTLNSANLVYHALKPPPCPAGYPLPIATAP